VDADRGEPLQPPLGDRDWRCSLDPAVGFRLGRRPGAALVLTASELALLQRLTRPQLPRRADGGLMGPEPVWLRLLNLLDLWCREHLGRRPRSLALLRQDCGAAGRTEPG
jgi:DNA repair protein RecO (recombination protein O)